MHEIPHVLLRDSSTDSTDERDGGRYCHAARPSREVTCSRICGRSPLVRRERDSSSSRLSPMSQIFTRGRILAHGITPRPATIVLNGVCPLAFLRSISDEPVGLRQEVFRGRTLQHRSYARQQTAQPQHPRTSIDSAITELPDTSKLTQHLDRVFAPLQFPPELAARILTHQSHRHGVLTNNARLSFIGA